MVVRDATNGLEKQFYYMLFHHLGILEYLVQLCGPAMGPLRFRRRKKRDGIGIVPGSDIADHS